MAVSDQNATKSHADNAASTSEGSFTWNHNGGASPEGILVAVFTYGSGGNKATGVTFGGTTVPAIAQAIASDTAGEPGTVALYYLGASVPTGSQAVVVTRTNDATPVVAMALTVSAATAQTALYVPSIVLLQEDGAIAEQNVDDGSPGSNSMRVAAGYWGSGGYLNAGANSQDTGLAQYANSTGGWSAGIVVESVPGQGSRPIGFSRSSDDRAVVHAAIVEGDGTHGAVASRAPLLGVVV